MYSLRDLDYLIGGIHMGRKKRSNFVLGFLLILIGSWFLATQFVPGLGQWVDKYFDWPVYIIGVGVLLLFFGLLGRAPGLAVPACIVGGIGGLLYWQNATGNWESWNYAWTLIPGFVGLGVILAAVLGEGGRSGFRSGIWLIFISLVMFAVMGSFLGAGIVGTYWPVLVIALGVWILILPLFKKRLS
jgi:hypothetical protein